MHIPGTIVFTGEQSRRGYRLNRMAMSLTDAANRTRFVADPAGYMRGMDLSDDEIETYCRCYANGMADRVTADDVRQMVAGGEPMAILRDKAVRVLQSCGEFLPAK